MESIGILSLPNELLVRIFAFLSVQDKLVIGDTLRHFRMLLMINPDIDFKFFTQIYLRDDWFCELNLNQSTKDLEIRGVPLVLKFIRTYRWHIKSIYLNSSACHWALLETVFSYINRYCENVDYLYFDFLSQSLGRSLKKSMKQVKSVWFQHSTVCPKLCDLNKWFPSIEEICFYGGNRVENCSLISVRYDHLKSLHVGDRTYEEAEENNRSITIEELNPQVRVFDDEHVRSVYDSHLPRKI